MTPNQVSKIISAMESAEIKNYMVVDDITTKIYQSDTAIIKVDNDNEMFVGIRANNVGGSHKRFNANLEVLTIDFTDAHEMICAGDYQKIIKFVEELGLSLTDEEKELIIEIDKGNHNIIPPTGDYNRFVPLTEEQYNQLTPEEKIEYDEKYAEWEEEQQNYIGQNIAARIYV